MSPADPPQRPAGLSIGDRVRLAGVLGTVIAVSGTTVHLADTSGQVTAQHRADRLLRRYTPQQLTLAHQAAASTIPPWPTSQAAIPLHWRHRLLILQTTNQHRGIPPGHTTYTHAAIYPDTIGLAAAILNPSRPIQQDPLAHLAGSPGLQKP